MKNISNPGLYGIIGFPVTHSLSPYMHNAAFARLKIRAVYLPFEVKAANLEKTMRYFRKNGIGGFNVTIPFKSVCMKYLDRVEPVAKMIGAVNTVVVKNSKLIGYNTDQVGFIKSLKEELKFDPRGKNAIILGAGGAARAVAFGLADKGAKGIYVYDTVAYRAYKLTANIKKYFANIITKNLKKRDCADYIKYCHLLVNCTPLGMRKADPLPIDTNLLHRGLKIYDVIYTPVETGLVKKSKAKGINAVGGMGMLLYQGAAAFRLWTGKRAPVGLMKKELLSRLVC